MESFDAIIFDFDGVLLESEFEGNQLLAELLTDLGHQTTTEDAIRNFVGYAGPEFLEAIERWIGGPLPPEFHERRKAQSVRALQEGVRAVLGAVEFVQSLPPDLPIAVASAWPSGSARMSTAAANTSRAASPSRTSICSRRSSSAWTSPAA
jgi:beta-phosphoglucomutase-like phosphatase (HAD superfamily)